MVINIIRVIFVKRQNVIILLLLISTLLLFGFGIHKSPSVKVIEYKIKEFLTNIAEYESSDSDIIIPDNIEYIKKMMLF